MNKHLWYVFTFICGTAASGADSVGSILCGVLAALAFRIGWLVRQIEILEEELKEDER